MSAFSRRGAALLGRGMSTCSRLNLSGIYPPVPTPFNSDETIAYNRLEENLEKWTKIPFAGIVVQGSNGECPFLSPDEKIELVRFTRKAVSSNKLLIAGSGCECKLNSSFLKKIYQFPNSSFPVHSHEGDHRNVCEDGGCRG